MAARLANGSPIRILNIIDEFTMEYLSIVVNRHLTAQDFLSQLYNLFIMRGVPKHIRSDHGSEFTTTAVREWLSRVGVKTFFI